MHRHKYGVSCCSCFTVYTYMHVQLFLCEYIYSVRAYIYTHNYIYAHIYICTVDSKSVMTVDHEIISQCMIE